MRGSWLRMRVLGRALPVVLALVVAAEATAQEKKPSGTISGRVQGLSEGLPGLPDRATVRVTDVATKRFTDALTDEGGQFTIAGLAPGTYDVEVKDTDDEHGCVLPRIQRHALAAGQKLDLTLKVVSLKLPVKVEDARTGKGVPGAKVELVPVPIGAGPVTKDRLYVWPQAEGPTDERGLTSARACAGPRSEEGERLLREAGWVLGADGVLKANAADYRSSSTPLRELLPPMKEDVFQDGIPPLTVPLVPHEGVPQSPGLWLFVDGEWHRIDDLGPTGIEDKSVFVLDGREVDQETNTTSPDQWRQSFLNGSRTVQFGPSIRLDTNLFGGGPSKALGADASSRPAANRSPGRAMTSFTAGIARSDEELEYDKIDDATPGGRDTTWSGTGTVIRAGVAQSLRFGRTLFLRFGYDHERLIETDMARSPAIAAPTGRVLSDGGRLSRHTHVAHARLGWSFRYLSPWAGVRLSRQTVRLTGQAAAEFQVPQGLLEQRISFVNEFKANRVMADFGLDVRIPRTGVFLRAQGATNGSDLRLAVSASHAWFRGR